jgi:hypothetical protein
VCRRDSGCAYQAGASTVSSETTARNRRGAVIQYSIYLNDTASTVSSETTARNYPVPRVPE